MSTLLVSLWATQACADEAKARIDGQIEKALRKEIERAVGVAKDKPDSRFDARRRAREAAESAIAVLRSEGFYAYEVEPDVAEANHPRASCG